MTTETAKALTKEEVRALAEEWFSGLNDHRAMVRMLPLLDLEHLKMVFPEATITGPEEFETWYRGVTGTFFDQDHIIQTLESEIDGDTANVRVVVLWKAKTWTPPAARSTATAMMADQTWTLRRSEMSGRAVISVYTVNSLVPVDE